MRRMWRSIVVFSNSYPLIGPIFWMLSIQYFIVQLLVARAWPTPYDLANNYISDLGNTVCGVYDGLYVCSPLHPLMNLSFIIFGITIALGALFIYMEFRRTTLSLVGFVLMSLCGFGTIIVGLFPENVVHGVHMLGAVFGLAVGNIGLLVLAFALKDVRREFRIYTALTAIVCLSGFALFATENYLGLGRGGMERLVSYPFCVWLMLFGLYMSAVRLRARRTTARAVAK